MMLKSYNGYSFCGISDVIDAVQSSSLETVSR